MQETLSDTVPICRLKVDTKCCTLCRSKVKENLQKLKGVESITYDSKGLVTVTGTVNPTLILKQLEKWGKKAEILPDNKQDAENIEKGCTCHNDSHSDENKEEQITQNKTKKGLLSLICKKFIGEKKKKLDEKSRSSKKWQFPMISMAKYGSLMPFHQPFPPYAPPITGMPPLAPPSVNPMIQYSNYVDNYNNLFG